ncbi:hypothetical protein [Candidatus Tisiphia endosymbiont of Micropterix aruncella]|uniref:hypothetical protein n=1 Tax=Candidatus Tisiphia endosymbiont of Micropterix aruncella TaxID=3066271 RepID=UPI003AA7FE48
MNKDNVLHVPIGSLAKYQIQDLYQLLQQVSDQLEQAKKTREWLLSAISLKYGEHVRAKRLRLEKDTGVIHLEDNGFKISCDVVKKVEWDQHKLAKIVTDILINGGNLSDFIETYYNISEAKYNSWSSTIKNIFEPARTLKLGKPIYKLNRLDQEVAL